MPTTAARNPSPNPPEVFVRLNTTDERRRFYESLPSSRWWTGGAAKSPDQSWMDVFEQADWHCIFCKKDLCLSTEAIAESTEDHLVPRALLEAADESPNRAHNLAPCCAACNSLKGDWVPPAASSSWRSRKAYVKACQQHIHRRRWENYQRYHLRLEEVLRARAQVT